MDEIEFELKFDEEELTIPTSYYSPSWSQVNAEKPKKWNYQYDQNIDE
jgi:hypothetical protein